jgi:hypothetical protein
MFTDQDSLQMDGADLAAKAQRIASASNPAAGSLD